ncbi:MAG: amidase family protein [Streptosporangiales bacterium]|nr:amidase family protein [Streptosporangiales bacterium]
MATWVTRLDDGDGSGPRLAVKDCIDVAGLPTGAGCPAVTEMAEPAENDAAVIVSARAAGARIAGKTALTELCWSANGVNHWQGTPVNPRDPRRVPGGSSSGSAVAVATGEADIGFGTDTGGSVRIPACCCGTAGLKTAFGRVPVKGVYPLAPSLDTVGPLGADLAGVEAGMRLLEPSFRVPAWEASLPVGRLRPAGAEADPAVDAAVDAALAASGVPVTSVTGPDFREALYAAGVIIDAEGFRSNASLMPYLDQLSPHIKRNMERGARLRAGDVAAARTVKDEMTAALRALLADYPVLVLPVLAAEPPLLGERGFPMTILTTPFNLAGLPALSLPVPGDVIASVQVVAESEETALAFGKIVEEAI